jgi:hypothetical protein
MPTYRPRVMLQLTVPSMGERATRHAQEQNGEAIEFTCRVMRASITVNDHNHADELSVTCAWKDVGTDPRLLRNASGVLYIGQAREFTGDVARDESGHWQPEAFESRFIGLLTRAKRSADAGEAMTVELEFLDYTTLFLEATPFGAKGVPSFSMRMDEAWRTICSQTPGAEKLADRLVPLGRNEDGSLWDNYPLLSSAVSKRFAKLAKVPVKPKTNAWAVWMQCVGMMGCISYIKQDQCILTNATGYYTTENPPRLVWGRNIRHMSESRNPQAAKGVGLSSFDPLTGRALEAVYPPVGDERVRKKVIKPTGGSRKPAASGHGGRGGRAPKAPQAPDPAKVREADERDWYLYASIHDPVKLLEAAKNTYEQKSRQELEGTISTSEMFLPSRDYIQAKFDILSLGAGDNIRIEFDLEDRSGILAYPDEASRVDYLVSRGYSPSVALLMARNMSDFALLDPTFYVKSVKIDIDLEGGDFNVDINYVNRILIGGDAAAAPSWETRQPHTLPAPAKPGDVRFDEDRITKRAVGDDDPLNAIAPHRRLR